MDQIVVARGRCTQTHVSAARLWFVSCSSAGLQHAALAVKAKSIPSSIDLDSSHRQMSVGRG